MTAAAPPQPTLSEHAIQLASRVCAASGATAPEPMHALRLTVPTKVFRSPWFAPSVSALQSAMNLRPAWDSYSGVAAHAAQVEKAIAFLANAADTQMAPPAVVPLSNGGVQLVWHRNGVDVEVTFAEDNETDLYIRDNVDGTEYEEDPFTEQGRNAVRAFADRLSV